MAETSNNAASTAVKVTIRDLQRCDMRVLPVNTLPAKPSKQGN